MSKLITDIKTTNESQKDFNTIATTKIKSVEDFLLEQASSPNNSFNAPILISWLTRYHIEEPTVLKGMGYITFHLKTADGCILLVKNNLVPLLFQLYKHYKNNATITALIVSSIEKLLECNFTRDNILKTYKEISSIVFTIFHTNMNNLQIIESSFKCLMNISRDSSYHQEIIDRNYLGYILEILKKYMKNANLIHCALRLALWISVNNPEQLDYQIHSLNIISFIYSCLNFHKSDPYVVTPSLFWLYTSSLNNPQAVAIILKKGFIKLLIKILRRIYSDLECQLILFKLLQYLSKTSEGFKQIDEISGAWILISQNTKFGDIVFRNDIPKEYKELYEAQKKEALIEKQRLEEEKAKKIQTDKAKRETEKIKNDSDFSMYNTGWTIAEGQNLSQMDRNKIQALKNEETSITLHQTLMNTSSINWNSESLTDFMGINKGTRKLDINKEYNIIFYEVVVSLNLLPVENEDRDHWFVRIKKYEDANEVRIDEMVQTIQEIKNREKYQKLLQKSNQKKTASGEIISLGTLKDLYVNGEKMSVDKLVASDVDVKEALKGILE